MEAASKRVRRLSVYPRRWQQSFETLTISQKSSTVQHGNHFEELAASKVKGQLSAVMRDAGERGEAMPAEKRAKGR